MSDLFKIPVQNEDEWKKEKEAYAQRKEQDDYWQQRIDEVKQEKQNRVDNYYRYGVDVPDSYYEQFNKIISRAESPEDAQEEAYRIGSAVKYSQMYDIPLDEAYGKVDALNEALFTDLQDQKGRFEALCDMFTLGTNTVKLGRLGQQLMQADRLNDTELSDSLKAQIDAINQQNVLLQDKTPRHWVMEALKAGAQSLPFTVAAAGAGLIGNFILPGIGGTAGAFTASSYLSAGQEYLDMLANGASPQTARTVAMVSGGIQGLIEADLGITKGIVKGAGKMIGKEAAERVAKKGLAEIGQKVFKRFHFGAGKKLLANYLAEYGKNVLGEGVEEFLQEITSIVGQEVAASLDGYDIPDDDMKSIVKQTGEAFKGGILGALALGFVPAGLNAGAEVKDYRLIKKAAENIESPEMFYEQVKDNPVFGEMKEASKKNVSRQIWEAAQQRKEEAFNEQAKEIAEGLDAGEGAEERNVNVDENGEEIETEAEPVARNENGRLFTQDKINTDENGNVTGGTFAVGDKNKSDKNRYGYITYSTAENGDITIIDFKMNKDREGLRGEVFDEFAREHPDVNIEWNPIGKTWQEVKEQFIADNPSGAKNGLNYYTTEELNSPNIAARKMVASELRKNIHNIETDGNGNFKRTELTNKQVAAGITLIESAAKRMNMSLADYVSKTFGNQIFGNREDFTQRTLAQGEQIENKAGGMSQGVAQANWREVGQQVKAVIYAGENADFSTWAHEMAHVFQNQLDGDLKTEAESAFNVNNGDWLNSSYTFKDGRTMSSAEAFAYGFQNWLETGKAENEQMKNIFQKFAQFIADAYNRLRNHLTFTPEIESVFNKLLDGDDTIMSKALKAAQEEENEYRAKLKRDAEAKEAQKKADAEEAKRQAQAEREEASEGTDFEEETEDESPEELEKKLDEATNENKEETNAIDDALENLPLADEKKAEIAEVLKDENSTQIDKAKAVTEAAASVYAENEETPDVLFQENLTEEELNNYFSELKPSDESINYKKQYYDDVQEIYEEKTFITSDGKELTLNAPKQRKIKQHEIDEAYYLQSKGYKVAFLNEPRNDDGNTHPDLLLNDKIIVELKQITGNANTAAKKIREAINKSGVDVPIIFFMDKAVELSNDDVLKNLNKDTHIKREVDGIVIIRNYDSISLLNKKASGAAYATARRNLRIAQEIESVKQKYQNTNKWLKAPNGEDSNLNEKQWLQVRTPSFKKWFGDWENDPANASKVLDENGEPLVVYHGTKTKGVTVFDRSKIGSQTDQGIAGRGFYFTPDKMYTLNYTDNNDRNIIAAFLNIRNPYRLNDSTMKEFNDMYMKYTEGEYEEEYYQNLLKNPQTAFGDALEKGNEELIKKNYDGVIFSYDLRDEYVAFNSNQIKSATDNNGNFDANNPNILFQKAYHGSGADFDKFDTENYGFSGEGSMSFGYGTYLTDSEEIARDYAERQRPYKKETLLYKGRKPETDTEKFISGLIEQANGVYETVEELKKYLEGLIKNEENAEKIDPDYVSSILNTYKSAYELLSSKDFDIKDVTWENEPKTRLYTVEIPDDGYLDFNKKVGKRIVKKIAEELEKRGYKYPLRVPDYLNNASFTDKILYGISHDVGNIGTNSGTYADLYELIGDILAPSENRNTENKKASAFLHSIGYVGIKYPAGTIHGNGNGAYNYVIFNDDDAKIIDHLLFQTNAELMDEARTFDSWQEFMEYCEAPDTFTTVEENPDAAWYKSFWEMANAITQEEEKRTENEERQQEAETDTPEMVDRLFISYIRNNPDVVDNFVQEVAYIIGEDIYGDEWAHLDNEEDVRKRERLVVLKDYINAELSDGNWQTAIAKVMGGNELTDYIRKRLITEMTDSYKARDFRSLYSAVMKDKTYAVDALDTRAAEIEMKLEKYSKRYHDIVGPTEDVSITTPQRRKEIALGMQNRDMAARIKAGSLKVDDEVYNYLKSVEKKEKDLKKQEQQLTDKIQGLYQDVGNTGLKMLINTHEKLMEQKARLNNTHEKLMEQKARLNNHNAYVQREIEKGLRMTARYTIQTQDMTQTYHELERKFSDLKDSMIITDEVQQILDAQEQRREIREEVARLAKERYLADETKKIRVNLVKLLFRKVDLSKVDFKQAQLIIAIQKLTLPNMIGGVNRWIGRNSPFLNAVLSRIVTDSAYKERIVNYLEHVEKQTDTFRDFVESIKNAKSREDFESWGVAEREYAIKYLPKENWVWELKLKEKARELQESLHLDITQEKVERQVYDADGHPVEDDEGNPVMETAYRFKIGDEALNKLLQENLGEELFNRIMNSPMVEWSTQEMEELVARVNQIRDEGITMRAAKLEARKREAQKFMQQIDQAVKDTGITLDEDDTPEEKEKKLEKINKILGKNRNIKGTEASKESGFTAKLNRILHGYKDANVLRVARILDNQSEGVNTYLLYRREDDCYNAKMRSIMKRGELVHKVMAKNKITEGELAKSITIEELGTKITIDELLFILAADKDFQLDENGNNDNYAATSRNAVCYGNMMSDTASQELKESWAKLDADMKEAIEKDLLTPEQRQLLSDKQLDTRPGTTAYIRECNRRWDIMIRAANKLLEDKPEYNALLEAIQADYAEQYERMNEVSIDEFNIGVNRVKCYVPLVRQGNNGETNENKVMEDLLAINGVGKNGVNKGMTQSRTSISPLHQKPVQTGLFRTWCDSVERTEHFITYAPYVRLLNRVYKGNNAKYLRSTIEGRYGKGMLEYIDSYISEVANPNAQNTRSTGAELFHILRGKTAPAYLGWKVSAIVKQGLTSPWPYMQFVNPAEYLAACFKCNNPKMWEAIQEKSVFMKNRRMDPINDLVDEMQKNAKNKVDKYWSSFTKMGMQGLEWIDWVCVAPGWYACYEKKYNQLQKASEARYNAKMAELEERNRAGNGEVLNPTQMETIARQEMLEDIEIEAVTYADDCTRQCQPSNRLTDLAPMFKDKNEFMKAFLQFQTPLNVIWQNIRYDMPYAVKQKQFNRIVGTVMGYVMAGIFMNSVMEGIFSGADDDDDKKALQALRNLIYYSTTQFTDAIPMFGSDFTNFMDQAITGKRGFMNSGTDMTPTASKLLSAFTSASKGNWKKAATLTAEGIGLFMGAPVSGVKEINKLLGKPLDEGDINLLRGLSDVYGIADDIIEE